jgi:signal transduction histidine kinase
MRPLKSSDILMAAPTVQTVLVLDEQPDTAATLSALLPEPGGRVLAGNSLEYLASLNREQMESVSVIFLSSSLPSTPGAESRLTVEDIETRLLPFFPLAALVLLENDCPLDLQGRVSVQMTVARLSRPLDPDATRQALDAAQTFHAWLRAAFWRWNSRTSQDVFEESIARILHDINNQITGIKGGLDLLDMVFVKLPDSDAKQQGIRYLNQFLRAGMGQTEQMIQRWRKLRGAKKQNVEQVALLPALRQAALALATPAQLRRITLGWLEKTFPSTVTKLHRIFRSCGSKSGAICWGHVLIQALQNALEAIGDQPDGCVQIEVGLTRNDTMVSIEIHDNGPGIPEEIRSDIWRAFFSTKGACARAWGWPSASR